jgi:hypothetical protein
MSRTRRIVALGAVSALGLAVTATAAGPPTITSLKATQKGNKVTVKIATKNFTIDTKNVGKTHKAGRGHEHFSMDGGKFDFPKYSGANGKLARQLGVQGKYSPSVNNRVTYSGLPKGRHTVVVHLVRNTHANYANRGATKKLTFTVR